MIKTIKNWLQNRSTRWIDAGEAYEQYRTIEQYENGAFVSLYRCQKQIAANDDRERTKSHHVVNTVEHKSEFTDDGLLWDREIEPATEADRVVWEEE